MNANQLPTDMQNMPVELVGTHAEMAKIRQMQDNAPELLNALEHIEGLAMAEDYRDFPEIVRIARAAIAKATGEQK